MTEFAFLLIGLLIGAVLSRSRDLYKEGKAAPSSFANLTGRLYSAIDQIIQFRIVSDGKVTNLWEETKLPITLKASVNHVTTVAIPRIFPLWLTAIPFITAILSVILLSVFGGWFLFFIVVLSYIFLVFSFEPWEVLIWRDGTGNRNIHFVNNKVLLDTGPWGFQFEDLDLSSVDGFENKTVFLHVHILEMLGMKKISKFRTNAIFLRVGREEIFFLGVSQYLDDRFGRQMEQICERLNRSLDIHRAGLIDLKESHIDPKQF